MSTTHLIFDRRLHRLRRDRAAATVASVAPVLDFYLLPWAT